MNDAQITLGAEMLTLYPEHQDYTGPNPMQRCGIVQTQCAWAVSLIAFLGIARVKQQYACNFGVKQARKM